MHETKLQVELEEGKGLELCPLCTSDNTGFYIRPFGEEEWNLHRAFVKCATCDMEGPSVIGSSSDEDWDWLEESRKAYNKWALEEYPLRRKSLKH